MSIVALDIETSSSEGGASSKLHAWPLEPWRKEAYITDITITNGIKTMYYKLGEEGKETQADRDIIVKVIDSLAGHEVWGQNMMFDTAWLLRYSSHEAMAKLQLRDTLLADKWISNSQMNPNKSRNLGSLVAEHLPNHPLTADFLDMKKEVVDTPEYWEDRNKKDTILTHALALVLMDKLPKSMSVGYRIECNCILPLARGWLFGVRFDRDIVESIGVDYQAKADKLLADIGLTEAQVRSPAQLGKVLFEDWELKPYSKSEKTGKPSTSKGDILHILDDSHDDRLKKLLEAKSFLTVLSKYVKGFRAATEYVGDNIIHSSPRLNSTYTHRMTYGSKMLKKYQVSIATHQLPRKSDVKKSMTVPEGYGLIYHDASNQEARVMGVISGDKGLIDAFNAGTDLHSRLCETLSGVPYAEVVEANEKGYPKEIVEKRQAAKVLNLSAQYKISAKGLRNVFYVSWDTDIDMQTSTSYLATYRKQYPGIVDFWTSSVEFVKREGYAQSIAGRRYYIKKLDYSGKASATNYPIQSSAADHTLLTMALIAKEFPQLIFQLAVHDSLTWLAKVNNNDELIAIAKKVKEFTNNIDYDKYWDTKLPIKLPYDFAVGYDFKQLTPV